MTNTLLCLFVSDSAFTQAAGTDFLSPLQRCRHSEHPDFSRGSRSLITIRFVLDDDLDDDVDEDDEFGDEDGEDGEDGEDEDEEDDDEDPDTETWQVSSFDGCR